MRDEFSNPYFISAPDGWCSADNRVMIVGKEGAGWGAGKNILDPIHDRDKIREYTRIYPMVQEGVLAPDVYDGHEYMPNGSKFWQWFRKIYNEIKTPVIWNNFDKIHRMNDNASYCKLNKKERELLHRTSIKVLSEEIKILQPTHVIFFGYYKNFLSYELPEIAEKLSIEDYKGMVIFNNTKYIFANHPNWSRFHRGYEDGIIKFIKDELNESNGLLSPEIIS